VAHGAALNAGGGTLPAPPSRSADTARTAAMYDASGSGKSCGGADVRPATSAANTGHVRNVRCAWKSPSYRTSAQMCAGARLRGEPKRCCTRPGSMSHTAAHVAAHASSRVDLSVTVHTRVLSADGGGSGGCAVARHARLTHSVSCAAATRDASTGSCAASAQHSRSMNPHGVAGSATGGVAASRTASNAAPAASMRASAAPPRASSVTARAVPTYSTAGSHWKLAGMQLLLCHSQ
jgi:hypothetical protein